MRRRRHLLRHHLFTFCPCGRGYMCAWSHIGGDTDRITTPLPDRIVTVDVLRFHEQFGESVKASDDVVTEQRRHGAPVPHDGAAGAEASSGAVKGDAPKRLHVEHDRLARIRKDVSHSDKRIAAFAVVVVKRRPRRPLHVTPEHPLQHRRQAPPRPLFQRPDFDSAHGEVHVLEAPVDQVESPRRRRPLVVHRGRRRQGRNCHVQERASGDGVERQSVVDAFVLPDDGASADVTNGGETVLGAERHGAGAVAPGQPGDVRKGVPREGLRGEDVEPPVFPVVRGQKFTSPGKNNLEVWRRRRERLELDNAVDERILDVPRDSDPLAGGGVADQEVTGATGEEDQPARALEGREVELRRQNRHDGGGRRCHGPLATTHNRELLAVEPFEFKTGGVRAAVGLDLEAPLRRR
ncbi:hypothetical protein EJB05_55436, partial [Eragrostis curvula]